MSSKLVNKSIGYNVSHIRRSRKIKSKFHIYPCHLKFLINFVNININDQIKLSFWDIIEEQKNKL